MLGDFFGQSFATATGEMFFGQAIHRTSPSAAFDDRFYLLVETPGGTRYANEFISENDGGTAGTVFDPSVSPPAPSEVTGLTSDIPGVFVARDTGDPVDVFTRSGGPASALVVDLTGPLYEIFQDAELFLPAAGPGDIIGRARIHDNNSALPQDRVYLDYSFFHNAQLAPGGVEVNRWAPGFEKVFGDGLGSVEVRLPMGLTLASNQQVGQPVDTSHYEFGNALVITKLLLWSDDELAFAAGLGVALPTGDDLRARAASGADVLLVANESVHLLPYLAALYTPRCSDMFYHMFLTFDFDANGNATYADTTGGGLERIGTWNDQNLVTVNIGAGSWLYQNDCPGDQFGGIAWSAELHYTATMNETDVISVPGLTLGAPNADLSVLNATVGGHARYGTTTFTVGYSVPLTSDERVFDGEVRAFVNRVF